MKIKMIATRRGCEDGFTVKQYEENHEYEIRDSLAYAFFAAGFAVPVKEQKDKRQTPKIRPWKREPKITPTSKSQSNSVMEKLRLTSIRKRDNEQ